MLSIECVRFRGAFGLTKDFPQILIFSLPRYSDTTKHNAENERTELNGLHLKIFNGFYNAIAIPSLFNILCTRCQGS